MFEKADATSAHSKYAGRLLAVASAGDGNVPVADSKLVARATDPSTYLEMAGGAYGVAIFQTDSRSPDMVSCYRRRLHP